MGNEHNDVDKLRFLIAVWAEHNDAHAVEYQEWAKVAAEHGQPEAAEKILQGAAKNGEINVLLRQALERLGGPVEDYAVHSHGEGEHAHEHPHSHGEGEHAHEHPHSHGERKHSHAHSHGAYGHTHEHRHEEHEQPDAPLHGEQEHHHMHGQEH